MLLVLFGCIVLTLVIGLVAKVILDDEHANVRITWTEYFITSLIATFVIVPLLILGGWKIEKKSRITFNEYRNGWETHTIWQKIHCTRDGSCRWDYQCDPYTVLVPYSYQCGKSTCMGMREETHYHSCPYVTEEWSFYIQTTLGTFVIDQNRLPTDPDGHRWRTYHSVPNGIIQEAGVGIPKVWQDADARLNNGHPGPVTKRFTYINYILRSTHTLLKEYEGNIAKYNTAKLLPSPANSIIGFYDADKVYYIGIHSPNALLWNRHLEYVNAELGNRWQGDFHIVAIRNSPTLDINDYANTLHAYWQSEQFDRDAISKNTIVLILAVDSTNTIVQSAAFNGMPAGNELLLQSMAEFVKNKPFNPDSILGDTLSVVDKTIHLANYTNLAQILIADSSTHFQRTHMSGYKYLMNEITLTTKQKVFIFIFVTLMASLVWIVPIMIGGDFRYSSLINDY